MLRAGFGSKLAWLADPEKEVVLVGRDDEDAVQAVSLAASAGITNIGGYLKRIDVLAACVWHETTVQELEYYDLAYAPPFSGVYDPLLIAARQATSLLGDGA